MSVRITRIINDELIDIREFAKPNACFQTNEYPDSYDFCILHEQFNPYDLINNNKIKDKEIARLNKIIERLETLFDTPYFDVEVSKQLGDDGFFTFKQMYKACNIVFKKRLKELKEEGKNE